MTETEAIELARAYVALSNAHHTGLIVNLFSEDAVYCSTAVGEFHGRTAIGDMMRGFFTRYPDVFWSCDNFLYKANEVSFDFELRAQDAESGDRLQRGGVERIVFGDTGLIKRLEVNAS